MLMVVIYDVLDMNVFVMGVKCDDFLVVVLMGLLYNMMCDEVEVVLVYEVSYIVNGDMVIMMLM